MTVIGYHASHEQHPPSELLVAVRRAEQAGFDAVMCSDHLAPWTRRQGESGYAWSWIAAALAVTDLPMGLVAAPGQRYHPAVMAQAIATLGEMFPGRFWAALGSGEALNEHVTGETWPDKPARQRRLRESVDAIRDLLAGRRVTLDGEVRVHDARLWTLPAVPVPLIGAAVSPDTAGWAADWADGLITVGATEAETREVLERYRGGGGRGAALLQVHLSLAPSDDEALAIARDQWAHCAIEGDRMWDLQNPEDFETLSHPTDDDLRQAVVVAHSVDDLADRIAALASGYDQVYLHHVGKDQDAFLGRCEDELLPKLKEML